MADVFISYPQKSAGEIVKKIAAELNKVGISCWYAERDMPSAPFSAEITTAIESCRVFLLVLNQQSIQSEYVKSEVHIAFSKLSRHEPITLLPFKVANCDISDDKEMRLYIGRFQIMDGNPPNNERIQELIGRILTIVRYNLTTPDWSMITKLHQRIGELEHDQIQLTQTLQEREQALKAAQTEIQELQQERAQIIHALEQTQVQIIHACEQTQVQIQSLKQQSTLQVMAQAQKKMRQIILDREHRIRKLKQQLQEEQSKTTNKRKFVFWRLLLRFSAILFVLFVLFDIHTPLPVIALVALALLIPTK